VGLPENTLYYGDNLEILRRYVADESVDLVYLDPPFNSNASYNVLFKEHSGEQAASQIRAFEDTWTWSLEAELALEAMIVEGGQVSLAMQAFRKLLGTSNMMAYLAMMAPRLVELRRVLKPTGSIYLHCDPTASHYLKILMDAVFGAEHFRSEIIWQRTNARSTRGRWPRLHDTLLFYVRSSAASITPCLVPANPAKMPHTLVPGPDGGRYQSYELTGAGTRNGETGLPWRGYDPTKLGRHWANLHATMDEWDRSGLIHWPAAGGFPRRRAAEPFDPASRAVAVGDLWTDVDRINQAAKELLGYPTQKPVALLERIVRASSNEGDVVLDPFCGCGTAIDAAQKLGRRWIGIDITYLAIALIRRRLRDRYGEGTAGSGDDGLAVSGGIDDTYEVIGEPASVADARVLAEADPYQFQWWVLDLIHAHGAERKKGADKGIDGRVVFFEPSDPEAKQIIVSVKAGKPHLHYVRDLRGVLDREQAAIGVLIGMQQPTGPMREEAATAGFYSSPWGKHPRLQLLTVEDLLGGKGIDCPPLRHTSQTFKKAPRAAQVSDLALRLNLD
jgi:DNA modification methylase